MSFQGYRGEVNHQVGREIPGEEEGAQMMQLTQVLPHHWQLQPVTTQNTVAVQQVRSPTKFGIPVFEDNSAASWLAWSQRVVYQARACRFEAELIAAKGEGLEICDYRGVTAVER